MNSSRTHIAANLSSHCLSKRRRSMTHRIILFACALTWCMLSIAQAESDAGHDTQTKAPAVSTQTIHNYRKVDDQISTAGQPSEAQIRAAAAEGFKRVIN